MIPKLSTGSCHYGSKKTAKLVQGKEVNMERTPWLLCGRGQVQVHTTYKGPALRAGERKRFIKDPNPAISWAVEHLQCVR